jgi:hypothetical protein
MQSMLPIAKNERMYDRLTDTCVKRRLNESRLIRVDGEIPNGMYIKKVLRKGKPNLMENLA